MKHCWSCAHDLGDSLDHFCPACDTLQEPPSASVSHFERLGYESPRFEIDMEELSQRFLSLQRQLHPDRFSAKSEQEKAHSEAISAMVNESYEALCSPVSRAQHMVVLQGGEDPLGEDMASSTDVHLLAEVMEMRERIEDLDEDDTEGGTALLAENASEIEKGCEELSELLRGDSHSAPTRVAELIVRMQYLQKIELELRDKIMF